MKLLKSIIQYLKFLLLDGDTKKNLAQLFKDKKGLEIGGPSKLFATSFPVYRYAQSIDGCNFSDYTVWEGSIGEGNNYHYYPGKKGFQFIGEASNLDKVESGKYDFLLASHCLEHCAGTLKTVEEWKRVLKPGGIMVLVLPHKDFTFDHKREVTSFHHLLEDFNKQVDERDLTHLPEIIHNHDLAMDKAAGSIEAFKERSFKNFENRCLHHHVFDFKLLEEIYGFLNIEVLSTKFIKPYHQVIIGRKK